MNVAVVGTHTSRGDRAVNPAYSERAKQIAAHSLHLAFARRAAQYRFMRSLAAFRAAADKCRRLVFAAAAPGDPERPSFTFAHLARCAAAMRARPAAESRLRLRLSAAGRLELPTTAP